MELQKMKECNLRKNVIAGEEYGMEGQTTEVVIGEIKEVNIESKNKSKKNKKSKKKVKETASEATNEETGDVPNMDMETMVRNSVENYTAEQLDDAIANQHSKVDLDRQLLDSVKKNLFPAENMSDPMLPQTAGKNSKFTAIV